MPTSTKSCARCGTTKPATEKYFGLNPRNRDYLQPYCRECSPAIAAERRRRKTERSRAWARNNPDKVKASYQRSYEKNRQERLAYMRRWREQNKDRIAEYQREYVVRKREEAKS